MERERQQNYLPCSGFDQFEKMGDEAMRYFLEPVVLAVNYAKALGYKCGTPQHGPTIFRQDGPNHLGSCQNAIPEHQMGLTPSGLCALRHIIMAGLSGGGWTTTISAAIDPRITLSMPIAGSISQ